MKIIVIILSISMLFGTEPFKGYIDLEGHRWMYVEGQYKDGMMDGQWDFYQDSTKTNKIATGSYIDGAKTSISRTGIPESGRDGLWIHYYHTNGYRHNVSMKNPIKAKQYWSNGKLNGKFTSYFKDGKVAVESNYKDGRQHGNRKEWYMGGFMYTKPFRVTEFKEGKPVRDTMYNLDSNLYMTSSYNDSSRIDSIYEYKHKSLIIVSEVKVKLLHGIHKLFHQNGQIWQEGTMSDGLPDGIWKEYSDTGILLSQVRYDKGNAIIKENEKQVIRDEDGNIIYSYSYVNDKRSGSAVELLHNVPHIIHELELNKMSRHTRCRFINRFQEYTKDYHRSYKTHANNGRDNMRWNSGYNSYALALNRYQQDQYKINWSSFNGVYKHNKKNQRMPQNKILGNGGYRDNIRIGKWIWTDMLSDKIILKGQYNDNGRPVGVWEESDPRDESNLIVTTYSDEGKVISVSKRTITYSNN